ncbi:MAG: N-acyl homoserine lactonase family protein [Clostridiales Family XIII bacterium]|jgi:glyoxylase-like metal-dependent hydrolase (beta-lactamase superfamily II)|nr:N-acyl homoserine lactonase family protein [Clostridiales Family XIII bacterium]
MTRYTIRPINTGFLKTYPKRYLYHNYVVQYFDLPSEPIDIPVFCFLLEGGPEGPILVDTGMCDTARANEWHHPGSLQPDGYAITDQLHAIGIKEEDIYAILFTHLHWDHCFHMEKFPRARYITSAREYAYAQNPALIQVRGYEHPCQGDIRPPFTGLTLETPDIGEAETEILPGITAFATPGHTAGHISFNVQAESGTYLLAGDAVLCLDNIRPIPGSYYTVAPPARFLDMPALERTLKKIQAMRQDEDHVLACHEVTLVARAAATPILR